MAAAILMDFVVAVRLRVSVDVKIRHEHSLPARLTINEQAVGYRPVTTGEEVQAARNAPKTHTQNSWCAEPVVRDNGSYVKHIPQCPRLADREHGRRLL